MNFDTLLYDIEDNILTITLNRPDKLNAFNFQMQNDLIKAFDETFCFVVKGDACMGDGKAID